MKSIQKIIQNLRRHALISLTTIAVLALLIVIFDLALTLNTFADNTVDHLNSKVDILFNLNDDAESFQINDFLDRLSDRPEVVEKSVTYPEQADEIFATLHPELADALNKFNIDNPFPTTVTVVVRSPDDHESLRNFLENEGSVVNTESFKVESSESSDPASQLSASASAELKKLVDGTNSLFLWMALVFCVSTLAIMINTIYISLFTRQEEIAIMRLVGASHSSIRKPYLWEGIFIAIGAVIVGNLLFLFITLFASWQEVVLSGSMWGIWFWQIMIAVVTSTLASYLAVEQYLRRQTIRF
jgi:cell division transport system permease protein